jgi:hypothetical protein
MKIRLIVPNYIGSKILESRKIDTIIEYGKDIASIAGGFTATQSVGGWIDANGSLIVEPVTVFDCLACIETPTGQDTETEIRKLARTIAADLHQDCVYLEIGGQVEFVKP